MAASKVTDLRSSDSGLQLISFDAFVEEKGRFNTSLTCTLSLYGGGSHYFEYADIWEDAYQDQPVGESRVHHGEWKIEEDGTLHLEGELYTKSTHMGGAQEEKVEEHKSLVFESLSNGGLKFVAAKSTFTPFSDGVVLNQSEVITASSPAVADEAAKQRRSEIAALASPEGKRLAQEKKGVVRTLSLEKVKRKRADSLGGDKSLSLTNSQTS